MYQIHWDVMKYLVDHNQAHKVVVRYNTNLSIIERSGINLYDLLPHFKNVNMCCSQDATDRVAEFIRTGLKYDIWLDNFKQGIFLNRKYGMDAMVIDVTVTLPGLLDMKELMKIAVELGVKSYVKITFDFDSAVLMSPMSLPRKLLDPLLHELIDYEKNLNSQLTSVYSEIFKNMLSRPTFEEKYPNDYRFGLKHGKERLQKIAKFRKDGRDARAISIEEIFSRRPEILEWWKQI
jgi:hypothetical protein